MIKIYFFNWLISINLLMALNGAVLANEMGEIIASGTILVAANANIYGANKTVPPAPGGGGAGVLPTQIRFNAHARQVVLFPNIAGQIACTNTPSLYNGADGGSFCLGKTLAAPVENISGITHRQNMFLVGVFTNDERSSVSTPPALDFQSAAGTDFDSLVPQLNQVFFIGDGRNSKGKLQTFYMPAKATHLFLGFVDHDNRGLVGFYEDNLGQLTVQFEIYRQSSESLPDEESSAPQLNEGLLAYYPFDKSDNFEQPSQFFDRSGSQFHGTLEGSAQLTSTPSRYSKAVILEAESTISLVNTIHEGEIGIPMKSAWTIATWFFYQPTDSKDYYFISPRIITLAQKCRDAHLAVKNDELGTMHCGTETLFQEKFYGSGFVMSSLTEGWHHLAAVGSEEKTFFYVDGKAVGEIDFRSTWSLYFLGMASHSLILDDFRVYNRALSIAEINQLSQTPAISTPIDKCKAHYTLEGKLYIPCVEVPAPLSGEPLVYEVEMEWVPSSEPIQFILKKISPNSSE